jgi:hypothetical protein
MLTRIRTLAPVILVAAVALTPGVAGSTVAAPVRPASVPRPQEVTAMQPTRVLDTRTGLGAPTEMLAPGKVIRLAVPAAAAAGAASVVLNLTATGAGNGGWVKAWPCDEQVPATSVLNFARARTVANAVISKLGSGGVCLLTSTPVHLIADLTGWFVGGQDFNGSLPNRILDTRTSNTPLVAGQERRLSVAGKPGIDAGARVVALNLTVDSPSAAGWLVAYPCGQPTNGSTVTFAAGEAVANLTLVELAGGDVCIRASVRTSLIVDTYGWSAGNGQLDVQAPTRLLDTRILSQWPAGMAASGATLTLRVAGRGGVPNDADSAWITVTAADPASEGFVTMWPCDQPFPTASTLNTWPNTMRSNLALVKLSQDAGTTCLRYTSTNGTRTNLVVDAIGWTTDGPERVGPSGIGSVTPAPTPAVPPPTPPATPPASLPASGEVLWSESFSSASGLDRLVKVISFGENVSNGNEMQSFNGDHDHACGSPATTRALLEDYQISTHFWYCAPGGDAAKGHFMTGINTVGYVTMSFSPKADDGVSARVFPATATQACWDQNITDLGARKWTQLVVISAARYKANGGGINYINPDFNDNGGDADIHLAGDDFLFNNLRNTVHYFNGQSPTFDDYSSPLHGSTDKATRYTICVKDNGNGTVTRTQARPGGTVDSVTGPGRFPAGPRVFIIQDDSYNPMKAYESDTQYVTDPFTWHWDNIRIST